MVRVPCNLQISDHLGFLQTAICGNTHSTSPASSCSTKWIEAARSEVCTCLL